MTNQKADTKQLRLFGLALAIATLFWTLIYFWQSSAILLDLWPAFLVSFCLLLVAIFIPHVFATIYPKWIKAANFLNVVITNITLGIAYFIIITPVAFIKRILGHDSLAGREEYLPNSYRQHSTIIKPQDMESPF